VRSSIDVAAGGRGPLAEAEALCPETLVLDLSRLEFLDSSGLGCILEAHARANNAGRRLALLGRPSHL